MQVEDDVDSDGFETVQPKRRYKKWYILYVLLIIQGVPKKHIQGENLIGEKEY